MEIKENFSSKGEGLPILPRPLVYCKGAVVLRDTEVGEIERMAVREDDIWVCSFPRSGTTLTQEMVYLIQTNMDFETARNKQLDERFPFLDLYLPKYEYFRGVKYIDSLPAPRFIKSHLHTHLLPGSLFKSNCKIIYVMRNPKDVAVSTYHFQKYFKQLKPEDCFETFCNDWIEGKVLASPWWLHVKDFWKLHGRDNILFLKYEDIVKDMEEAVIKIARFFGKTLTDEQVSQIVNHCQFDKMKTNQCVNGTWIERYRQVDEEHGSQVRKGKIGEWRNYFTPELNKKMDDMVKEHLGDLDLTFDFGDCQ